MNWPNRITIARVALIPVIVVLLQFDAVVWRVLALIAFMVASLTDWLDGYLARRLQIVTNFGKFLDPVADKLLVLCTMIALCGLGLFPAWVCIVVLFRELAVDGLRLVAVELRRMMRWMPTRPASTRLSPPASTNTQALWQTESSRTHSVQRWPPIQSPARIASSTWPPVESRSSTRWRMSSASAMRVTRSTSAVKSAAILPL